MIMSILENGTDIDNWMFDELQAAVEEFQSRYYSHNGKMVSHDSQSQTQIFMADETNRHSAIEEQKHANEQLNESFGNQRQSSSDLSKGNKRNKIFKTLSVQDKPTPLNFKKILFNVSEGTVV